MERPRERKKAFHGRFSQVLPKLRKKKLVNFPRTVKSRRLSPSSRAPGSSERQWSTWTVAIMHWRRDLCPSNRRGFSQWWPPRKMSPSPLRCRRSMHFTRTSRNGGICRTRESRCPIRAHTPRGAEEEKNVLPKRSQVKVTDNKRYVIEHLGLLLWST